MSGLLSLSWRNLWRHRRRTLLSMSAIGFGLTLVLFYSGLIAGVLGDAKNQLDIGGLGHVEIFPADWRQKRPPGVAMPAAESWEAGLGLPAGAEVAERVLTRGLASSAHGNEAVEVLGVDWAREPQLTSHLNTVRQGALPAADDLRGVLVGEQLAERLRLKPGSKLRVMVQRADGEMGADLLRVRGVYHSVAPAVGKRQIYVSREAVRALLGLEAVSHQYVIQLPDAAQADVVAARLQEHLGPRFEVKSWSALLPILRRMEDLVNSVVFAVAIFVYALVGLGILNTMLMSVLERTREFGVLMAIGTRPNRVVALVVAESFWMATLAVLAGGALGGALTWYFSQESIDIYRSVGESFQIEGVSISTAFKTRFWWSDVAKASSFVYVMALIVGVYPATRVSRLEPAEALRRA